MGKALLLIKPEAYLDKGRIKYDLVMENNFSIDEDEMMHWKREQMEKTYSKERLNYGSEKANEIMSGLIPDAIIEKFGPNPLIEVLILSSKGDTIRDLVNLCGPRDAIEYVKKEFKNTLRGRYGLGLGHSFIKTIEGRECRFDFNGTHKSSEEEYEEDVRIYFPRLSL